MTWYAWVMVAFFVWSAVSAVFSIDGSKRKPEVVGMIVIIEALLIWGTAALATHG